MKTTPYPSHKEMTSLSQLIGHVVLELRSAVSCFKLQIWKSTESIIEGKHHNLRWVGVLLVCLNTEHLLLVSWGYLLTSKHINSDLNTPHILCLV